MISHGFCSQFVWLDHRFGTFSIFLPSLQTTIMKGMATSLVSSLSFLLTILVQPFDCNAYSLRQVENLQDVQLPLKDLRNCNTSAKLHSNVQDALLLHDFANFHDMFDSTYKERLAPGTLIVNDLQMFSPTFHNSDFIFWGIGPGLVEMSLYEIQNITIGEDSLAHETFSDIFEGNFRNEGNIGYTWRFRNPFRQAHMVGNLENDIVLDDGGDYIAFIGNSVGLYQHILIDHLGYIAFLKKSMPARSKLVLPDVGGLLFEMIEMIDPEFIKRIIFLECEKQGACNTKSKNQK